MNNRERHLVFVYGTLRQGLPNHHFLTAARALGSARTKERYALYVAGVPKVVAAEAISQIQGELYLVDNYTLAMLDDLEDHPFTYRRQQVPVIMADGAETLAWLYFQPHPGGFLVPDGDLLAWLADQQDGETTEP
ncbi:MAG: gamma-glutamylcyclotransferase family protein [Desulfobacca sp.]|uniref:gamma-glutamylcyclotransferase family protein n=1 Tax=Desulfobacca sp. TaxID=2067990 RepID=UPI00404B949B